MYHKTRERLGAAGIDQQETARRTDALCCASQIGKVEYDARTALAIIDESDGEFELEARIFLILRAGNFETTMNPVPMMRLIR